MLTLRLQRLGKKRFPTYRLIVSEKGRDTNDMYLENLGSYNPHAKANQFVPKAERIQYWLKSGAQTSGTVHNLLVNAGLIQGKKKRSVFLSKKRAAKLSEKKSAQGRSASGGKAAAPAASAIPATPSEAASA